MSAQKQIDITIAIKITHISGQEIRARWYHCTLIVEMSRPIVGTENSSSDHIKVSVPIEVSGRQVTRTAGWLSNGLPGVDEDATARQQGADLKGFNSLPM